MTVARLFLRVYALLGPARLAFFSTLVVALLATTWNLVTFVSAAVLLQGLADFANLPQLRPGAGGLLSAAYRLVNDLPHSQRLMLGFVATIGSMLIAGVLNLGVLIVNLRFLSRFFVHVQSMLFERVLAYRMEFHDDTRRSHLNQLIIVEARACYNMMKELTTLASKGFRVVVHVAFLLYISPVLSVVAGATGLAAWLVMSRLNGVTKRWSSIALGRRNDVMALAQEALYGIRQVKLLGIASRVESEFGRAAADSASLLARVSILLNGQSIVMQVFGLSCVMAIVGLVVIAPEALPAGGVVLFLFVASGVIPVLSASAREWGIVNEQIPAVESVLRFLDEDQRRRESGGKLAPPVLVQESIVFDSVSLDYEGRPGILKDVSLRIRRGERLGIVGPSGSGKTSLTNLIPRLYDPTAGRILIDGIDLREFDLEHLRRRVGLLSQDIFVFNASVRENIRLGRPHSSQEEIIAAAELANAHDFIMALPQQYDTILGDQGVKLSGGQRQRIGIAQIFLKRPEVIILDEPTSALDSESEALVQDAIDRLSRDRTVVLVAHRLSTLRGVDRLLVLENGRIVEEGTWDGLRRKGGAFARMLEMQASAML